MVYHNFSFKQVSAESISATTDDPVDPAALEQARAIVNSVKDSKDRSAKLLQIAHDFKDIPADVDTYIVGAAELKEAFVSLPDEHRIALQNIHDRVKKFADAQRASVTDVSIPIPGGMAGHVVAPCVTAGCYAPGGRYPLPSSVIMTAVTARSAGCKNVIVASPRPATITLAAAYISGADLFVKVGGAQAIAAMAYGVKGSANSATIPPCDVIVGPGNKWVTAAKSLVSGHCGIDMLAGPSEVLVIADDTANAAVVAADLIAQAEHDVVARPILVTSDQAILDSITAECEKQLEAMPEPNRSTATEAFAGGYSVCCKDIQECIDISDHIAPEHLEVQTRDAQGVGERCQHYGGLFIGEHAAEVLGDYGAGPNHTLPTGGTGKYTGGLSVFNFLRIRTWMRVDDKAASQPMVEDSVVMERLEGLEGHARAAEMRRDGGGEGGGSPKKKARK
jgi:phosphoribosyl-ATP pyrophosphohydrolase/phosphoribosyl-AMP cyclohydrolase/histidinol dehydrogenase